MTPVRVVLVLIWVTAFLSGRALFDISTAVSEGAGLQQRAEMPRVREISADVRPRPTSSGPRLDLYGNPIDEAISDYRVDGRGDMYERHAPDTALLRLGSPGA
jgi:hypothetical protein